MLWLLFFRKVGAVTNKDAVVTALKETLRYGLFLGTFAGTFVSVDEIVGAVGGYRRHVQFTETIFSLGKDGDWFVLLTGGWFYVERRNGGRCWQD